MQLFHDCLVFILNNQEVLSGAVLSIIAILKLTAWGRAKAEALNQVVAVIEHWQAHDIKRSVAMQEDDLSSGARDALHDAVAEVDAKQTPQPFWRRLLRELVRGLLPGT